MARSPSAGRSALTRTRANSSQRNVIRADRQRTIGLRHRFVEISGERIYIAEHGDGIRFVRIDFQRALNQRCKFALRLFPRPS